MATVVVNVLLFLNCRLLEVAQANEDPSSSAELLYGSFRGLAALKHISIHAAVLKISRFYFYIQIQTCSNFTRYDNKCYVRPTESISK